jgi:molybdopterin-guanine dinucleotide biosynthesis protein A
MTDDAVTTQHDPDTAGPLPGYILAGGASSRFGSDKARAVIDGTPLIRRVADGLAGVCAPVTAVAQTADAYADLGLCTIPDAAPGCGPVQGLLTALTHRAQSLGPGWVLLTACDTLPRSTAIYAALIEACRGLPEDGCALACQTDRWHPMPGLFHTGLIAPLAAYLADGGRSFQGFLSKPSIGAAAAARASTLLDDVLHITSPHDLPGGLRLTGL